MQFRHYVAACGAVFLLTAAATHAFSPKPISPPQSAPKLEQAMAPDASPSFLVATIRPTDPSTTRQGWSFESEGRQITCANATLNDIVRIAYGVHARQIVDAPGWFSKERFDIKGVPDEPGVPSIQQLQHMYQQLLADRFHLVLHHETRDLPIYAITVAKGGPLLTPAKPEEVRSNAGNSGGVGFRILKATNLSLSNLALNLNLYEDRPVIDQTALEGKYDFTLKWTYDVSQDVSKDVSKENETSAPPSLIVAMKEQLGLRLEAVKGPAPVLVIDQVEHPTSN